MIEENASLSRIRTLKREQLPPRRIVYGFVDGYIDDNNLDLTSQNYAYDSRGAITPTRTQGRTVISDTFQNLSGWNNNSFGTGSAAIIQSGSSDPAIGTHGVRLSTGSNTGSHAIIEKDAGTIPSQFGILIISTLEQVGDAGSDALEVTVENVDNKMLKFRNRDNNFEVWADSHWQLIFQHGGNYATEWWVNAYDKGDGTHKIDVYAGSEGVGSYTGVLDSGSQDGRVIFKQLSNSANYRASRIWLMEIGITQLTDNMALISKPHQAGITAQGAKLTILLEDVTNFANTSNIVGKINGELITFNNLGVVDNGIIDYTKNVYLFSSDHVLSVPANEMTYEINILQNQFIGLLGVDFQWS